MALKWVWKMNENGQGCALHACWGGVATYRHKNWPVLLSKNRICLSSCAVMVIGMVGWLMTRLIWLLPLESAHNIHILTHNVLPAQSSLSCQVFTRRLHKFTTDNLPQKSLSRDNHNPQFPWHQKLPSTFYEQSGRSENLAKKTTWLEPTIRHLLQNKITIIFFLLMPCGLPNTGSIFKVIHSIPFLPLALICITAVKLTTAAICRVYPRNEPTAAGEVDKIEQL